MSRQVLAVSGRSAHGSFRPKADILGAPDQKLAPGTNFHVRFEGGILVPAIVKWTEDGLIGLEFVDPIILDRSDQARN